MPFDVNDNSGEDDKSNRKFTNECADVERQGFRWTQIQQISDFLFPLTEPNNATLNRTAYNNCQMVK